MEHVPKDPEKRETFFRRAVTRAATVPKGTPACVCWTLLRVRLVSRQRLGGGAHPGAR